MKHTQPTEAAGPELTLEARLLALEKLFNEPIKALVVVEHGRIFLGSVTGRSMFDYEQGSDSDEEEGGEPIPNETLKAQGLIGRDYIR